MTKREKRRGRGTDARAKAQGVDPICMTMAMLWHMPMPWMGLYDYRKQPITTKLPKTT